MSTSRFVSSARMRRPFSSVPETPTYLLRRPRLAHVHIAVAVWPPQSTRRSLICIFANEPNGCGYPGQQVHEVHGVGADADDVPRARQIAVIGAEYTAPADARSIRAGHEAVRRAHGRSTASISRWTPANAWCCSGRPAAARPRCCGCSPASSSSTPARSGSAIAASTSSSPPSRDVAMVFQNYALYPHLTVFDNIAFPLRTRRVAAGRDRAARARGRRTGRPRPSCSRAARRSCRAASSSASRSPARSSGTRPCI